MPGVFAKNNSLEKNANKKCRSYFNQTDDVEENIETERYQPGKENLVSLPTIAQLFDPARVQSTQ